MDPLFDSQVILGLGAIVMAFLLLRLFLKMFRVEFGSIAGILFVVLVLYFLFGVSPKQLWYEVSHLLQDMVRWIQSLI